MLRACQVDRALTVVAVLGVSASLCLAACSSETEAPAAPEKLVADPRLATERPADGELVFRGKFAPRSYKVADLRGRYLVRFQQWAPEDPARDFEAETAFVASLVGTSGGDKGERIRLFRTAAARGERRLELSGRYLLDVAFGDFPYVVRFTPRG
jgi:hypothetical protein